MKAIADQLRGWLVRLATSDPRKLARFLNIHHLGVKALALHDDEMLRIVEQCLELSIDYAKNRVQFGKPIGEFQLIQLKLAKMEVARLNIQNLVFRQMEMAAAGKGKPGFLQ